MIYFQAQSDLLLNVLLLYYYPSHIAQNITETCQKYFQSFIAIEILSQYFC